MEAFQDPQFHSFHWAGNLRLSMLQRQVWCLELWFFFFLEGGGGIRTAWVQIAEQQHDFWDKKEYWGNKTQIDNFCLIDSSPGLLKIFILNAGGGVTGYFGNFGLFYTRENLNIASRDKCMHANPWCTVSILCDMKSRCAATVIGVVIAFQVSVKWWLTGVLYYRKILWIIHGVGKPMR